MERNFRQLLEERWSVGNFVCVGLDSEFGKIPESAYKPGHECTVGIANTMVAFNREIVEATQDMVCAYKLNSAFYEESGNEGMSALWRTIADINRFAPHVPVILDAKRADIGNTNNCYVTASFGWLRADAITVHPYLGREAMQPFLDQKNKGIIVLCRTTNKGAGEFQDLHTTTLDPRDKPKGMKAKTWLNLLREDSMPLYQRVAFNVARDWNTNGNCLLVVGATYPLQAKEVREIVGDMAFLLPGIGTQGGDVEATVMATADSRGYGMIINASSSIIFASSGDDYAEAARRETMKLRSQINLCR
jgi:orotidine-5'-phosphate decarboxylase